MKRSYHLAQVNIAKPFPAPQHRTPIRETQA